MAVLEASDLMVNGRLKFNGANTRASVITCFKSSKTCWASTNKKNRFFCSNEVSGPAMEA